MCLRGEKKFKSDIRSLGRVSYQTFGSVSTFDLSSEPIESILYSGENNNVSELLEPKLASLAGI